MDLKSFWNPFMGAVSLTFDDGNASQLKKAIPAMDRRNLKGSFYLSVKRESWREDMKPWVDVSLAGHEIGNHTLSHPCANSLLGRRGGLDDLTLSGIEADILAAQERLVEVAPHQTQWTFAYTCYQTFVGRGATQQSYVPVVAKHFLSGRAGGEYGIANHPEFVDLASTHALATDRMSGFEMMGLVEGLAAQGQWVILVFHEIDGARLTVGNYDFHLLLDYLHRRSGEIWTAPVVEVARKIAGLQEDLAKESA